MDTSHGKYLGVDYGDKRTGLAECDISGMLASGICTINEGGMRNTAIRVAKEAAARACKKIIIIFAGVHHAIQWRNNSYISCNLI